VAYIDNAGRLLKNGALIGSNASTFRFACNGDVAWQDRQGRLYKNATTLGEAAFGAYGISLYSGVVVHKDPSGNLYRDGKNYGQSGRVVFVPFTGDVVWKDIHGNIHKNGSELGANAGDGFSVARYTGDVAWQSQIGSNVYKNGVFLGLGQRFLIADRTGDVAWVDLFGNLHRNEMQLAGSVFWIRYDGVVGWRDAMGDPHYR